MCRLLSLSPKLWEFSNHISGLFLVICKLLTFYSIWSSCDIVILVVVCCSPFLIIYGRFYPICYEYCDLGKEICVLWSWHTISDGGYLHSSGVLLEFSKNKVYLLLDLSCDKFRGIILYKWFLIWVLKVKERNARCLTLICKLTKVSS